MVFAQSSSCRFPRIVPILGAVLLLLLLAGGKGWGDAGEPQKVLILHSYDAALRWTADLDTGMQDTLSESGLDLQVQVEYLDSKRNPGPDYITRVVEPTLRYKLAGRRFDLVLVSDNDAFDFVLKYREELFAGTPIVFSGVNGFQPSMVAGYQGVTGVVTETAVHDTVELMVRLHPAAREILVIGSTVDAAGRSLDREIRPVVDESESRVRFSFYYDLTEAEASARLGALGAESLVILSAPLREDSGRRLSYVESARLVRKASPVPVYGYWDFLLGNGIVGGKVLVARTVGEVAAALGVRILRGEEASAIPISTSRPALYMFDDQELRRFAISPALLPRNSLVLNRPTTYYSLHKWKVWGALGVLIVLASLALAMILNMSRRRAAERALKEKNTLLQTIIDALPAPIFYKDDQGLYLGCNEAFEVYLGHHRGEIVGHSLRDVASPELAGVYEEADRALMASGGVQRYEATVVGADGVPKEMLVHKAVFTRPDGTAAGVVGAMVDIGERKALLAAARLDQERLLTVLDSFDSIIYVSDMKSREILFDNRYARETVGGMAGNTCWRTLQSGESCPCDHCPNDKLVGPDGEPTGVYQWELQTTFDGRYYEIRDRAIRWNDGRLVRLEIATDVTERRLAQIAFEEQREFAENLVQNTTVPTFVLGIDHKILFWNRACEELTGASAASLLGTENGWQVFYPEQHPLLADLVLDLREAEMSSFYTSCGPSPTTKGGLQAEGWYPDLNGRERYISFNAAPIRNARGEVVAAIETVEDITGRKRAAEELQRSRNFYLTLFEAFPSMIWRADAGGGRDYFNRTWLAFTGRSMVDQCGDGWHGGIHPEDRERVLAEQRQAFAVRQPLSQEYRLRRQDGSWRWVLDMAHPFSDLDNDFRGFIGHCIDITERKASEDQVRKLSLVVEQSPLSVVVTDVAGTIEYVNASFSRLTGYASEDVLGKTPRILKSEETPPPVLKDLWKTIAAGKEWRGTLRNSRKGGGGYWEAQTIAPLKDENGVITHFIAFKEDITERKDHERQLEALGRITDALRAARGSVDMYPIILEHLLDLVALEGACLLIRDPNSESVSVEITRGVCPWRKGNIEIRSSVIPQVFKDGVPYVNLHQPSGQGQGPGDESTGSGTLIVLPLNAYGETNCAICVGRSGAIPDREISLLFFIANLAASAIRRAMLHEQMERQLQRLSALRTVDMAIAGSLDLRLTLNILLEQILTHLNIDAAAVLLYHPTRGLLECAASKGFHTDRIQKTSLKIGEGAAGAAIYERSRVSIDDLGLPGGSLHRSGLVTAEKFVSYHCFPLIARGEVKGVLEVFHRSPLQPDGEWFDFFESLSMPAAIAIETATLFSKYQRSNADLVLSYDKTIEGWSRALDLRDKETEGHSLRVTDMATRLAQAMGMEDEDLLHIRRGALLHDIGKVGIPDSILLKPGPLSDEEWVIMKKHPTLAFELLSPIAYLRPALDVPYGHHEKWDGSGYPRGLKGEQIPLAARIFAVVDVWDALRSDRPYRQAWPEERVRAIIAEESGSHFDPRVADTFLAMDWSRG